MKIFTTSHKRPDFLELQLKTFKRHLKEFEFIVFNNAVFDLDKKYYNEIHKWCKNNNIKCIDVQKDNDLIKKIKNIDNTTNIFKSDGTYADPGVACAYPLEYGWEKVISKYNEKICIIDSDMFFIKDFEFNGELAFVPQSKENDVLYMWNGIIFADLSKISKDISFWCSKVLNTPVDVGGQSHFYLKRNKHLDIQHLIPTHITEDSTCNFYPPNYEYIALNNEYIILHHRGGSNWDNMTKDYLDKKTAWLKNKLL